MSDNGRSSTKKVYCAKGCGTVLYTGDKVCTNCQTPKAALKWKKK